MPFVRMALFTGQMMVTLRQTLMRAKDAVFVIANAGLALSAW
jgi:hypothetical protein